MTFANVNIGAEPADGTGDPLRTAFDKINKNFANIATGTGITVQAPVQSVAGKTGNITLSVTDVIGATSTGYVTGLISNATTYTPETPSNWASPAPTTIVEALDRLALVVKTLNSGTGA